MSAFLLVCYIIDVILMFQLNPLFKIKKLNSSGNVHQNHEIFNLYSDTTMPSYNVRQPYCTTPFVYSIIFIPTLSLISYWVQEYGFLLETYLSQGSSSDRLWPIYIFYSNCVKGELGKYIFYVVLLIKTVDVISGIR